MIDAGTAHGSNSGLASLNENRNQITLVGNNGATFVATCIMCRQINRKFHIYCVSSSSAINLEQRTWPLCCVLVGS